MTISQLYASFNLSIKDNKIVKARVAYGGMSETPKRAISIEKKLNNSIFSKKF